MSTSAESGPYVKPSPRLGLMVCALWSVPGRMPSWTVYDLADMAGALRAVLERNAE